MDLRPLIVIQLRLGETQKLGAVPRGERIVFPIVGGTFTGRLRGEVLPGGADWVLARPDGAMELDLRLTLRADDGALIYTTFQGLRRGDAFRTIARYETAAPQYAYLNKLLAAGSGALKDGVPTHTFDEIV